MRNKQRQMSAERPWSVSGISQICRQAVLVERDPLAQLSFSESAINEIVTSPPRSKTKSFVGFSSVVDRNVSSSTIEEATLHLAEGSGSRNGSLRRRRFKLRKRGVVSIIFLPEFANLYYFPVLYSSYKSLTFLKL